MTGVARVAAPFVATAKQVEAARACADPGVRVIALDGAYRSAKTQAGARQIVEWALQFPAIYLVARQTYRALKDSTQRAMLHGDGDLPPLIPKEAVAQYLKADETVRLVNGAEIIFRSLEQEQTEKLRGLTLGGILVDQVEELDGGDAGERIYDTLLGRLSDSRGPRKLIAISNPASLTHWVYRRLVNPATRDSNVRHVHFRLADNPHLPADYVAEMEATAETRPHWYRSFVEGQWGAFAGMAFAEWDDRVHVVKPFAIPAAWARFASLDHGANNPTAALAWAATHDGELVCFDAYNSPGLVSQHAPALRERMERGVPGGGVVNRWARPGEALTIWADPSAWANHGHVNAWGRPASIATEYAERGIHMVKANNDRAAGYMRLLELVHIDEDRFAPPWAQIPGTVKGAPRLYVFAHCRELIEQLKAAPVAVDGVGAGECIDPKWATSHGHQVDALRYGAMSRKGPSPRPVVEPQTPGELRAAAFREFDRREQERFEESGTGEPSRYVVL